MFDVSFTELMVIGVVALIVIGPERLPRVARTAGHMLGRLQRYVNEVKSDISREMHMEDLRKFERDMKSQMQSVESSVKGELSAVQSSVDAAIAPSIAPLVETGIAAATEENSGASPRATEPIEPPLSTKPPAVESVPSGQA